VEAVLWNRSVAGGTFGNFYILLRGPLPQPERRIFAPTHPPAPHQPKAWIGRPQAEAVRGHWYALPMRVGNCSEMSCFSNSPFGTETDCHGKIALEASGATHCKSNSPQATAQCRTAEPGVSD